MQDLNFHPLSDRESEALADDTERNGQRTPIEVTPDERTIDGHQRERAAQKLNWDEVQVLVRYDLAGDEAAIERRMIEANCSTDAGPRPGDLPSPARSSRRTIDTSDVPRPRRPSLSSRTSSTSA